MAEIGVLGWIALAGTVANTVVASRASGAATDAAGLQVDAANRAADLQYKAQAEALAFQKQQYAATQEMMAPYVKAGTGAVSKLSGLLGIEGVSPSTWSPGKTYDIPASGLSPSNLSGQSNGGRDLPEGARVIGKAVLRNGSEGAGRGREMPAGASTGQTASLRDLYGSGAPATPTTGGGTSSTRGGRRTPAGSASTGTAGAAGTVTMRAPDGTAVDVPVEYQDYYASLGYEVVTNG